MPKPKDTLDRVNINTPCEADWDEMVGNDEVRFCRHCDLSVYNFSAMTRPEALRLVVNSKGKLCARYIRLPNGEMQTTDLILPKLHSIKRRASRLAAGAFTAALTVSTSVVAASPMPSRGIATSLSDSVLVEKSTKANFLAASGASISGIVKDPSGALIAGATVTLINKATAAQYTSTTDEEGQFRIYTIEEGSFTLTIESPGFETREIENIDLRANVEKTIDETLYAQAMGGLVVMTYPSDPLVAAVVEGNVVMVKELLATGADVNVLDKGYDSTALAQAVANGNLEIVDVLINAGADVNKTNGTGHTALMSITGSTTAEIVSVLINAGAKTDLRDDDGKNALHYAAINTTPDVMRELLYSGVAIDARDQEDQTALMVAASAGNTELVTALLKAGASMNLRDEDGSTALGLAIENDRTETIKALQAYGATE